MAKDKIDELTEMLDDNMDDAFERQKEMLRTQQEILALQRRTAEALERIVAIQERLCELIERKFPG